MIEEFVSKHAWDSVAAAPYLVALVALLIFLFGAVIVGRLTKLIGLMKDQKELLHETLLALRKR